MTKLIFGCGYVGRRAARMWRSQGERVVAVSRSDARGDELRGEGFEVIQADVAEPSSLTLLPRAETVLYAVGYDRDAGRSRREVYVQGLSHVVDALPAGTGRLIYVSSTGVWGDCGGRWIDEQTPCRPDRESGRVCLEAEQVALGAANLEDVVVLRLGGIYGPGRIPNIEAIRRGDPISFDPAGYLNLIHVDDAVAAVRAAEERGRARRVYAISDGRPCLRREFYEYLAQLSAAVPPQFAPRDAADSRSRGAGSKRVRNTRMTSELGVEPQYESYRAGLRSIVGGEAQATSSSED